MTVAPPEPEEDREPSLRGTVLTMLAVVLFGFCGFLGWASLADLDSAAVAPGEVIVDSQRKTVSHLEGGILHALLVRDGDRVGEGEVLLRLDGTQARAAIAQLESRYWAAAARAARLRAEDGDHALFEAPAELRLAAATDAVAAAAVAAEERLFRTRRQTFEGTLSIQLKRIAQLLEQVGALEAQRRATADRLAFTDEEATAVKQLLAKGFERKPRLLELQGTMAELRGELGELSARQAEAREAIAAAELEMLNLRSTRRTEVANELQASQTQAADLAEGLRAARDVLARQEVRAPQAGRVVDIRFLTPGSVVPAGAPILDLVPAEDAFVVEAKVSPTDIDSIHAGGQAHIRLSAFRQRSVPPVTGEVLRVSADRLTDERTGQAYYLARLRVLEGEIERLAGVALYPGMPVEVYITGTRRKAIDYFLAPLTDSMRRAFREE